MKHALSLFAMGAGAAVALGVPSNPVVSWDVSADNGATWSSVVNLAGGGPASVTVRGALRWTDPTNGHTAFAAASFDGSITGTLAESGGNIIEPLQHIFNPNTGTVANLGGGLTRFSLDSDTGAPGSNATWWIIGQDNDTVFSDGSHTFPDINLDNPAHFLYFDLNIDYSANHSMTVSSIMNNQLNRAVVLYNQGANGGYVMTTRFNSTNVAVENATINVSIPSPAAASTLVLGVLFSKRRRNR